jgi:hypothetical protein
VFSDDAMAAFYAWDSDPGGVTPPRTSNDSIVVDRDDVRYYLQLVKPTPDSQNQIGRSLQFAVVVRDPDPISGNCNTVPGLNNKLVLSVTDITQNNPDKGKIIGDSQGILGILNGNGLTWASTANQYRANLDLVPVSPDPVKFPNSKFTVGHKYRGCVMSPAFYDQPVGNLPKLPVVSEACVDFFVKP